MAVVAAVSVGSVLAALALRPSAPGGYAPDFEASLAAACRRSAPDVDDPAAACRCAARRLAATVPFGRLAELSDKFAREGRPPPELVSAVEGCQGER